MPIISFTERDLLRGVVVEPAWYRVRIDEVGESLAASGKTTNYPVEGTILFNADTGATKFKDANGNEQSLAGVPTPAGWMFNSGAIGFAVGYLAAFGVDVKAGQRIDLAASKGKELDVFIENDTYQGRLVNRINHKYRAPRPEVTAVG